MNLGWLNGSLYNPHEIEFKPLRLSRCRRFYKKERFNFPLNPYFIASEDWSERIMEYCFDKPSATLLEAVHLFISAN